MAAKVLTFVLILTYYRTVPGQSTCMEDQFACVGDSTCKPRSYLCDGVKDCVDGSDEINCEDCHCRERLECRMNTWCAIFGCDPGWTGYKCAFPTKDISSTLHVPTTTIQSLPDASCHCEIQSLCADRIQSTTCNCQEGWSGYRCSEMLTFALDDSWKMIGVGLVVIIVFSVVSLALAFLHRLKRRGYSRSHQRLIESQESLRSSSIPPQLCSAPPSYEDVIGQEAQRHSSHNLILTANDNSVEEPPPPSYDSVIKHQQELLQGNQTQGEPVQQDTINHGTIELQNEGLAQTQTESTNAQNRTETSDVQHDS